MAGGDDRAWMPPATSAVPAETLEGYDDLQQVARGGDSVVYRARQQRPVRVVAVKVLLVEDDAALRRFQRELELTVALGREHPHIVTVLDTGTTGSGRPCLVMDFAEQGSLHDRLVATGPASLTETVACGTVLADALGFAHERGVVHRDVKPQNVLLLPTSYVLTDFGVARLADAEHTAGAERFSYRHASPQVLDGRSATALDDVWSVGSTMFTMLDGRPPFASDEPGDDTALAYLRRVRTEEPRPLPDGVPEPVAQVVRQCLAKDPAERWPSAADLYTALQALPAGDAAWAPGESAGSVPPHTAPAAPPPVAPVVPAAAPPTEVPPPVARSEVPATPVQAEPARQEAGPAASALAHETPAVERDAAATGRVAERERPPVEVEPPRRPARRVGLFVGAALLLGVALGGVTYLVRDDGSGQQQARPRPSVSPSAIVPVQTATAVPSPSGPVITDPGLAPRIDDLRSRGSSIAIHWTDPSGGKATFIVVRSDKAGGYWSGQLQGKGTGGTLETWGPQAKRPCFVVIAFEGERRGASRQRCVTMG